jgi:hypothetical protein
MKYIKLTIATLSILALSFPSATFAYGFSLTQTADADFNGGTNSQTAVDTRNIGWFKIESSFPISTERRKNICKVPAKNRKNKIKK